MQNKERGLVSLSVPRSEAREKIKGQLFQLDEVSSLLKEAKNFQKFLIFYQEFSTWQDYTKELLRRIFTSDALAEEFSSYQTRTVTNRMTVAERCDIVITVARHCYITLNSILERIELYPESQGDLLLETRESASNLIDKLATRFPQFASQLLHRQRDREPFHISDEYDLQDIFHALLRLFFDDVRPEEYTPSYAGKSSKMDFIIKSHQIVVELKMSRDRLGHKTVGDQLIIDIARYKAHPDCRTLLCVVYDPEHLIENPTGLENDLSRTHDNIDVRVTISPK